MLKLMTKVKDNILLKATKNNNTKKTKFYHE